VSRVDDDEHLRRKVGAPAVEQEARHFDLPALIGMFLMEKMQSGKAMLSINDQVLSLWLAEVADRLRPVNFLKTKCFIGKKQHRTGNHRLSHDGLIKIDDLLDLLPIQDSLKPLLTPLDPCNELRDLIMFGDLGLRYFLAFKIVPARETNLFQQIAGVVGDEIKHSFFLGDSCRQHKASPE